jgi:hypothetical protein
MNQDYRQRKRFVGTPRSPVSYESATIRVEGDFPEYAHGHIESPADDAPLDPATPRYRDQSAVGQSAPSSPSTYACMLQHHILLVHWNSASTPLYHAVPFITLATVRIYPRLCARLQLRAKLRATPYFCTTAGCTSLNSASSTHPTLSSRRFSSTKLSSSRRTQLSLRSGYTAVRTRPFEIQKRFCQSEVTSSFVTMASDRDILPAWWVFLRRTIEPQIWHLVIES